LNGFIFPAEALVVDANFVRDGTRLAAMEMIKTGTTTFTDMYYFEDDAAEGIAEVGLRGILGEAVIGFPAPNFASPPDALSYTRAFSRSGKAARL
jgi:5-methylthioadenosine/S-adenosylhomocysteine deaminase